MLTPAGIAVAVSVTVKMSVLDRIVTVVPGLDTKASVDDVFEHVVNGVRVLFRRPNDSPPEADPPVPDKAQARAS